MTNMRRTFMKLAAATAASAICAGAAVAQEVTLKLHHFLPGPASLPANVIEPWANSVEEASGGRIKIDRFYAMALGGSPLSLMDQVQDGVVDIVVTLPGYSPGRYPRIEAFELPFMITDAESASAALWEYGQNNMMDQDFQDVKVLGLWVHGPGIIHSKESITTPADLNGVKLRSPTRVTNMMFTELGATGVGMPVPAVPESLSKGVIDATVIPWEVTTALKVAELVDNHTEFGDDALYTATFIAAMNKDSWNAMPADLQEILMSVSGADFSAMAGRVMQEYDAPGRAAAVAEGNNIVTLSADQVQMWKDAAAPTLDAWVADMDGKGIDGAALVEEAKALIAKHSGM